MKKGDVIIYKFVFDLIEAKVIEVYSDNYVKVRQKGFFNFGYTDIIPTSRILNKIN